MIRQINRRSLLGNAAAATSIAALSQPFLGVPALAGYAVAPAKRRAVSTLATSDPIITGYRTAVAAMRALPSTDACSWAAQAAIHASTGFGPAGPCQHGSFFWAWHRMYLYWFERIVRHKSGMYDWALPYWDYDWETTPSSMAQRQIPAAFRVTTSSLYDGTRDPALNGGGSLSTGTTATAAGFIPTAYMSAQSSFQGTPHNVVHTSVCGDMCGFDTAGLDPVFWLHHCNIDRLWNLWLARANGRADPLNDSAWKNTVFKFYDECCLVVSMTACDILRAAQQLSYVYEVEPPQVNEFCQVIRYPYWWYLELATTIQLREALVLGDGPRTLALAGREDRAISERLVSAVKNQTENLILQFTGVEADRNPGAAWEVYVGLPANAKPDAESPNFVGNVALFGDGIKGEGHKMAAEFTFPLNRALRASSDPSALQVTFVPTSGIVIDGRPKPAEVRAPVRIGGVNLMVETKRAQEK